MVVVEHQGKIVRNQRELVHEGGEDGLGGGGLGGAERTGQIAGHARDHPLQGSDDVGKEAGGVIVRGIQSEPAGTLASMAEPLGEERGLAETGRRRHQDQACRSPVVQEPGQAGTSHEVGARRTSIQLRRQETAFLRGFDHVIRHRRGCVHLLFSRRSFAAVRCESA